jgi:hypothetical protein
MRRKLTVVRLVAALIAWSALVGIIWAAKGGHIGTCLPNALTGEVSCPSPDSDVPQLAAWVIGVVLILGVGVVLARRH